MTDDGRIYEIDGQNNKANGSKGPVRLNTETITQQRSSTNEEPKDDNPAQQKPKLTLRQGSNRWSELITWRDLRNDVFQSNRLAIRGLPSPTTNGINTNFYNGPNHEPNKSSRGVPGEQSGERANLQSGKSPQQLPLWRRRGESGLGSARLSATQVQAFRSHALFPISDLEGLGNVSMSRSPDPPFNRAVGMPVQRMGNFTYTFASQSPLPANAPAVCPGSLEPVFSVAKYKPPNIRDFVPNPQAMDFIPTKNGVVTQDVPVAPMIRPMDIRTDPPLFPVHNQQIAQAAPEVLAFPPTSIPFQPSTYPDNDEDLCEASIPRILPTPSQPTVRTNSLITILTSHRQQETQLTPFRRERSVSWADELLTPGTAPPGPRHCHHGSNDISSISTCTTTLVHSAPAAAAAAARHAAGDRWRAQYADIIIRYYNDVVFAPPAAEGDHLLKNWYMSSTYHGYWARDKKPDNGHPDPQNGAPAAGTTGGEQGEQLTPPGPPGPPGLPGPRGGFCNRGTRWRDRGRGRGCGARGGGRGRGGMGRRF